MERTLASVCSLRVLEEMEWIGMGWMAFTFYISWAVGVHAWYLIYLLSFFLFSLVHNPDIFHRHRYRIQ